MTKPDDLKDFIINFIVFKQYGFEFFENTSRPQCSWGKSKYKAIQLTSVSIIMVQLLLDFRGIDIRGFEYSWLICYLLLVPNLLL